MSTDYQFKVGDKGLTRDGQESYEVIAEINGGETPLVVVLTFIDGSFAGKQRGLNYRKNGFYHTDGSSARDLMPPTRTEYVLEIKGRAGSTASIPDKVKFSTRTSYRLAFDSREDREIYIKERGDWWDKTKYSLRSYEEEVVV